jgi:circadian clock protein KaiC
MRNTRNAAARAASRTLPKAPTGVIGLDEITGGGLPRGRTTLVCGGAGCGKTLLALDFLIRGATQFREPGVFVAFEETAEELTQNVRSLGYDLERLIRQRLVVVDYVRVERSEIDETGEYDLEGLFVRLAHAIDSIGAKRVVLDTVESLFSGFSNEAILRAELRRLFRWLKGRGVTAVVTGERGDRHLTRQGLEEYVSDCVILLDHRVSEQVSTRRLRVVKYRGSTHGTNEYPFLIDDDGISVIPITSVGLDHPAPTTRVSSGIPQLDAMLGGAGVFRASSVLLSGTAGTGKSTVAAHFAAAACRRGERCLYMALEESPSQIVRNMRSVGLDLEPLVRKGLLRFDAARPTLYGLEMHLARMHRSVEAFDPKVVVIDPLSNLTKAGTAGEAAQLVLRLIDFLKARGTTAMLTSLTQDGTSPEETQIGLSSLADTWLLLRDVERNGERNRGMYVLKSRGMAHSNQIREFVLTSRGVHLREPYLGPEGMLTGSSRLAPEAHERAAMLVRRQEEQPRRERRRRHTATESQVPPLRAAVAAEEDEMRRRTSEGLDREALVANDAAAMVRSRRAGPARRSETRGRTPSGGRPRGNGGVRAGGRR